MLQTVPVTLTEAIAYVDNFHRHNKGPQGGLFAIGASNGDGLVGVAIVGRPVARALQDGYTAEITRVCVHDKAPRNCNSFLYSACWRAARAMGYSKIITYTLASESGSSLKGAGFVIVAEIAGRCEKSAWQGPDRAREWQPVYGQLKLRWQKEK
jgi:hypothetical protein